MQRSKIAIGCLLGIELGCSEHKVGRFNSLPEATITSHAEGATVYEGETILLTGRVSDPDHAMEDLLVTWRMGQESICNEVTPTDAGGTTCEMTITLDSETIMLEVTDPESGAATDSVEFDIQANQAPTVELLNPTSETAWYADRVIDFEAQVNDVEDPPEDLVLLWTSDLDGDLDTSAEPDGTGSAVGLAYLSEGEHRITLTVTDTMGKSSSETTIIEVGPPNTAPECSISLPFDGSVSELGAPLEFKGVAWDSDTDDLTLLQATWRSSVDGLLASTQPDSAGVLELTLESLSRGTHDITLSVTDPADDSCSDTAQVIIGTPPEVSITSPLDGTVSDEGTSLTLSGQVTDGDESSEALSVVWSSDRDGTLSLDTPDTTGSISVTIDTLSTGTHQLSLIATDSHAMTGQSTVQITVNGAPTAPVISLAPNPANTNDDLVAQIDTDSSDPEGDVVSYAYSWSRDGSLTTHTSDTVPASDTARGETWVVEVTPNDGRIDGSSTTASITIGNSEPEITSLSLSPLALYTDDSVVAVVSTNDADGDGVTLSYAWTVDGIPVAETSDTLDGATWFSRDQVVAVTVTPHDGTDSGIPQTDTVTVLNSSPAATNVTLSPSEIFTNDEVRAVVTGTDSDGDGLSYQYDWYVDGAIVAETSSTLAGLDYFDKGQLVYVVATPNDGTVTGTSATSSTLTVSNSPPEVTDVDLTPDPVSTNDSLVATPTATDADGDSVTFFWSWDVSGSTSAETSDTLDGSTEFDKGDTIVATVTPDDGDDTGDAFTSDTVTVGNALPEVVSGGLSPSVVYTNDTLTATVTTTDDDGDSVDIAYIWTVEGSVVSESGSTLDGASWFDKNQTVQLDVTLTDSSGDSVVEAIGSVTISNTIPTAPTVAIDPEEPRDGTDDILCEIAVDGDDDDGDTLSYAVTWSVDGVLWSGSVDTTTHADDTIPGSETEAGEIWTCTATADDGEDFGGSDSASVTIIQGFGGWASTTMSAADADLEAEGEDSTDYAGYSVGQLGDIDGDGYDDFIIGGYGADTAGVATGMAFIVKGDSLAGSSALDLANADYRIIGEEANDYAGKVVRSAGDVDGDGLPDVLVTAHGDDTNGSNAGKAYLMYSVNLSTAPELYLYDSDHMFYGESAGDQGASAASTAGDVDGDGCDDLLFGAYGNDEAGNNHGATYLWLCSSLTGEEFEMVDADFTIFGNEESDFLGGAIAGGSDYDGDGYSDFLLGADGSDSGGANSGEAYLFSGGSLVDSLMLAEDADVIFVGEDANDEAGTTLAMPGDVDGDDLGDVLIGAHGDDSGGTSAGKSYLFFADSISISGTYDLYNSDHAFIGVNAGDSSSLGLSGAGDVDRDGRADILIGSPMNDSAGTNTGTVYLILSDSLPSSKNIDLSTADYAFTGENIGDYHGYAVSGAGDVNGDELDDFLIGAPYNDDAGSNAGAVYLWLSD